MIFYMILFWDKRKSIYICIRNKNNTIKTMDQNNHDIVLSAGGVFVAIALAQKHELPISKVIDLLNDFINIDGSPIQIRPEVC